MMTAPSIRTAATMLENNININKRSAAHLTDDDASSSSSSSATANFSTALVHSEDPKGTAGSKRQSLRIKSHEAPTKPKRKRISQEQFQKLSELFEQTDTPNYELREKLAVELNMTNREVQVWFQNRRAKYNRARQQEQQRTQQLALQKHHNQRWQDEMLIHPPPRPPPSPYPRYYYYDTPQQHHRRWQDDTHHHHHHQQQSLQPHHYQDPCDSYSSTSSSSSSNVSAPTSPYPTLSPNMAPLEILAMAADYVQRYDQEEAQQQHQEYTANKKRRLEEEQDNNTRRSWRPWL